MKNRELIVPMYLKDGKAVQSFTDHTEIPGAAALAAAYGNHGADALILFDLSEEDPGHDATIGLIKTISRATDLPLYGGGRIRRLEDVKKLIYAGCRKVLLNFASEDNCALTHEASARFGQERMLACVGSEAELAEAIAQESLLSGMVLLREELLAQAKEALRERCRPGEASACELFCRTGQYGTENAGTLLGAAGAAGILCDAFRDPDFPFMEEKHALRAAGISVNTYEPAFGFPELKTNADGLVPVIAQDYRTGEVLMLAYMNEEAFLATVRTGRMTYFSRSRQELWVKGLTSGHFQYLKELRADCDNDTLLARIEQIGAACHTGNRSCFYRPLIEKAYDRTNPLKVFEDVFAVILDRKEHPKEGSYTNYLFDKGIDKILKKVGEEATEIIIAAKNPDPEEIKYEISDFLYHVMVLMAERGVSWEDITEELARR